MMSPRQHGVLLALAMAVCLSTVASRVQGQSAGLILSCVDLVHDQPVGACYNGGGQRAVVAQANFRYIQGWQFECQSGEIAYTGDIRATFYNNQTGATWTPPNRWLWRGYRRDDVYYAYVGVCPALNNRYIGPSLGFVYELFVPPPVGDWHVVIQWTAWTYPSNGYLQFDVTVTP